MHALPEQVQDDVQAVAKYIQLPQRYMITSSVPKLPHFASPQEKLQALHTMSRDRPSSFSTTLGAPLSARAAALAEAFGSAPSADDNDDQDAGETGSDSEEEQDSSELPGEMESEAPDQGNSPVGEGQAGGLGQAGDEESGSLQEQEMATLLRHATWQVAARPLFFTGDRNTLKEAAGQIMLRVMGSAGKQASTLAGK